MTGEREQADVERCEDDDAAHATNRAHCRLSDTSNDRAVDNLRLKPS